LQKKIRENKTTHEEIRYEDVLMKGQTGQVDGLGRAPKGVNDGNGFFLYWRCISERAFAD
jgi:AdoMet-dependent heme synthase